MIRRVLKTVYDIFPVLNRPMALCALLCFPAILILFYHTSALISLLILFAFSAVIICNITRNKKLVIVFFLFLAVCFSTADEFMLIDNLQTLTGQTVTADFMAVEDAVSTGTVTRVTAYCYNSDVLPKRTKFELHYFFGERISCGDRFSASVKIMDLEEDYKTYNYGNGIYMGCRLLKINNSYTKNSFFAAIGKVRNFIVDTICKKFTGDIAGILIALNTGDKSYISNRLYDKVLVCGISHIMVVSGLHLSIVLGSIFTICDRIIYNRYLKSATSLIMIFLICALCGFKLSILRAGIMFLFMALSPIFLRKNDSLNSLGAAVILLLFNSPLCVLSVAFQLSVLSTLAIVWIAPYYIDLIISKLYITAKPVKTLISILVVSISAMIFTAPITISTFGTVSLLSPISFLLVTFPVTYALSCNTAALLLSAIKMLSFLAKPLFLISGLCAMYIRFIIDNFGELKFMLIKADFIGFLISITLALVLMLGMYLSKYYQKLVRRNTLLEVKNRARNLRKRA